MKQSTEGTGLWVIQDSYSSRVVAQSKTGGLVWVVIGWRGEEREGLYGYRAVLTFPSQQEADVYATTQVARHYASYKIRELTSREVVSLMRCG